MKKLLLILPILASCMTPQQLEAQRQQRIESLAAVTKKANDFNLCYADIVGATVPGYRLDNEERAAVSNEISRRWLKCDQYLGSIAEFRKSQVAQQASDRAASNAAFQQSMELMRYSSNPNGINNNAFAPRMPTNTTCSTHGQVTNCTTY